MAAQPAIPFVAIPPVWRCGAYRLGHDMHFIQARLAQEGQYETARIVTIDDDGTIGFLDHPAAWNHDPQRLRALVARFGPDVTLHGHGVLRIGPPESSFCCSIASTPDPCRAATG